MTTGPDTQQTADNNAATVGRGKQESRAPHQREKRGRMYQDISIEITTADIYINMRYITSEPYFWDLEAPETP